MALHQLAWFGTTPIGALLMDWVIRASSPRVPFVLGGLAAVLCAVAVIGRRPVLKTAPIALQVDALLHRADESRTDSSTLWQ